MDKQTSKPMFAQDWHLNQVESLMRQWDIDDGQGMTEERAQQVLQATQESGRTMRQMSRMHDNLASMRETVNNWMSKPSVILPTLGMAIAGAAYVADAQLTQVDLEHMKDIAAITQAEYDEMVTKVAENSTRAREVMTGVLGLGVTTAIAMNLDRFKGMITRGGQLVREASGADPEADRLTQRLTATEREELQSVMATFRAIVAKTPTEQQSELMGRLIATITRTERQVQEGSAPASQIYERLMAMKSRLQAIEEHQQMHDRDAAPTTSGPTL